MPSSNGHGPKRAILYARVSTDEQARSGYSLAQQLEALRDYAALEGYEVIEEVADPGQSGASLERPGMDRVRDLVAAGGVSVVLAQDRDRFAREPAYHYLLRREFEEHATKIRALNDRGDESPEGELTDGILDQLAKFERAKTAERTRRGKLRKAREGKILANNSVDYGFKYNATRNAYLVDEEAMSVVRRIFYSVGVEGESIKGVAKTLNREGVKPPASPWSRSGCWGTTAVRDSIVKDDVYKPHTYEEIAELVAPEVAARLDPSKLYGIWWYNRTKANAKQVSVAGKNGREYKRQTSYTPRPRSEWIAVPVPDSGIPREWIDAAREAIKNNHKHSNAGRRSWELSGGIVHCGTCSYAMVAHTTTPTKNSGMYFYYACRTPYVKGRGSCSGAKHLSADKLEKQVWEAVSGLLNDPERLHAGLDAMLKQERAAWHGNPDKETELWAGKLAEAERMRRGYQEQAAKGYMTLEELGVALEALEKSRQTAECELTALRSRKVHLDELERDRDALLESYARMVPEELDRLTAEERHQVYKMLRLKVVTNPDGSLEVSGAFGDGFGICETDTVRSRFSTGRTRRSTACSSHASGRDSTS
jgi:site-specific DNA recombinase